MDRATTPIVRLLMGLCVLSLLLAPLVGRAQQGRSTDDGLRIGERSDANVMLVASSPQLAKPTAAPEPATAALPWLPFLAFIALSLRGARVSTLTSLSGFGRPGSEPGPGQRARGRVTELRI